MSNVRDFGAAGDGTTDDTLAIQHAIDDGEGVVEFGPGEYRITAPIKVDLAKHGPISLHGSGGVAKLIMDGPGPAIQLLGNHTGSADPHSFRPDVWRNERMPTVSSLEIEGRHKEADGIHIEGVAHPTLTGVLIRRVRNAVHVTKRARNLLISHCHIYHNTGIGVYLDHVNLHQAIISGSHISYCRLGGVRIQGGEIRNVQITGNDIEYNNNRSHKIAGMDDEPTAEVYIDAEEGSIREGTITSNTIQATYSPGGANIRFVGRNAKENHKAGMWTISANLIGSQETNVHLTSSRGITITGNYIYSGHHRNLLVEDCRDIVVGDNCFGHNPDYGVKEISTGVRFQNSTNCIISGLLVQDSQASQNTVPESKPVERDGLVELVDCRQMTLSACQFLDGAPYGLYLENCSDTLLTGCTIVDNRQEKLMQAPVHWAGDGSGNIVSACRLGSGTEKLTLPEHVRVEGGIVDNG